MSERLTGLARLRAALSHSVRGLRDAWSGQDAFRLDALAVAVAVPAGLFLGDGAVEKILLIGSVVLIMIVELLNSAIEAVVDRVSLDLHELSRRAKDYGSAAVLFALFWCGGIWAAVVYQRWWA